MVRRESYFRCRGCVCDVSIVLSSWCAHPAKYHAHCSYSCRDGKPDRLAVYAVDVSIPMSTFRKVNELSCPGGSLPSYHARHRSRIAFSLADEGLIGLWDYMTGHGVYMRDGDWASSHRHTEITDPYVQTCGVSWKLTAPPASSTP